MSFHKGFFENVTLRLLGIVAIYMLSLSLSILLHTYKVRISLVFGAMW